MNHKKEKELVRMNFNRISAIAVTAFAVTLPFSLLACSESNPTNFDEPIAYSEPAPGPSSALETSSSVTDSSELPATPCTAENEGKVEKVWHEHLPTNGIHSLASWGHYSYHRCEKGSWVEGGISLSFDTAGVQVGDAYIRERVSNMQAGFGLTFIDIYTYAGDGNWNLLKCDADRCMEKLTVSPDRKTAYYSYSPLSSQGYSNISGWHETDEADYICFTKKVASNDTCVIESGGEKTFYAFANDSWDRIDYDPVLGFCSWTEADDQKYYGVKDEKLYYCKNRQWTERNIIPRQYTDSRKKNLTDDEFDVLDLPKEASVGDLVGGLLEDCFYGQRLDMAYLSKYTADLSKYISAALDVCIPQRYYRYGKDGTWTLDTGKERAPVRCRSENEGSEYSFLPQVSFITVGALAPRIIKLNPGAVYQCVGGRLVFKDFAYGRYMGLEIISEVEANPNLVPRQYTDPRKEGLTDEEYDVLDLPKEASVGDRVGGLLENCLNDKTFSIWEESAYIDHIYDYCMPRNYYIFREDGSWSMETAVDMIARYDSRGKIGKIPNCTPETLGNKVVASEPLPDYPGKVVQCIYDQSIVPCDYRYQTVEYIFGRAEKKN